MGVIVHIQKSSRFLKKYIRRFLIGNIEYFPYGVDLIFVGIYTDSDITFMISTVHISVNRKYHVTVIGYIENTYIML